MGVESQYGYGRTYKAMHYSGANVSVMIGPHLLTQCFGITYQLNQSKRPIFGYHSQYFDAVADGVVLVSGQLMINYTHSQYLPTLLHRYHTFKQGVEKVLIRDGADDLIGYLSAVDRAAPLVNYIRSLTDPSILLDGQQTYNHPEVLQYLSDDDTIDTRSRPNRNNDPQMLSTNASSNSSRALAMDSALNYLFENDQAREDMIGFFTGGLVTDSEIGSLVYAPNGQMVNRQTGGANYNGNRLLSNIENNMPLNRRIDPLSAMGRPDQFTNSSSPVGIDIAVHFGPPFENEDRNQIINYQERSSFVLKDVHFSGEAGEIANNDRPIMEVYSFFARKKEYLDLNA